MKSETILISEIVDFISENVFDSHYRKISEEASRLDNYKINPIIIKYLSILQTGRYSPSGVAKALLYPRVLGTSISTSTGIQIQQMFVKLKIAKSSMVEGMDIEFIDKTDKKRKYCQLKSGPNNINSGDVKPIMEKFDKAIKLGRANGISKRITNDNFIVGVLYGNRDQLSKHYIVIDEKYPVYIGDDFWYRITGYKEFYKKLEKAINIRLKKFQSDGLFKRAELKLRKEIESSTLFKFR